jgi:hypothetical protein
VKPTPREKAISLNEARRRMGYEPVDPELAEQFFMPIGGVQTSFADRLAWLMRKTRAVGRRLRWLAVGR